jgi:glycosyltransferase involved in cell wall biosynthesis
MFSIVIPVYNHARYLREAVTSAIHSDLVKEVLLCDDGSNDESAGLCAALALEYPSLVRDYSENPSVNNGTHNRLNMLCKLSNQPWIRILNSDDFFLTGSFETIRNLASIHHADFISGSMLICDEISQIIGTKRGLFDPEYPLPIEAEPKPLLNNEEVRRFLLNQNFIATTSNMAFTRNLFDRVGGFRDFRYVHDLDFALRATIHGVAIHTASYLVTYRSHSCNTISEESPHMDGEFIRLYSLLLHEHPEIEEDPEALNLLQHNRHIEPFPHNPRRNQETGAISKNTSECKFSEKFPKYARPNALLALGSLNNDFVIITDSLDEPESQRSQRNIIGFATSSTAIDIESGRGRKDQDLRGILIRCTGGEQVNGANYQLLPDLKVRMDGTALHIGHPPLVEEKICSSIMNQLCSELKTSADDNRPLVYVMPVFLAVGGAERNMIEVIRALQDQYRFMVITTERICKSQGSLHWQLYELGVPVFDLAEIAGQKHHLYLLSVLAGVVSPDLIWICNGSPWIVENSVKLRRLFANIPIIDQEVYDAEEGWINHYHKKGIQSFNNFIAINSKIENAFQKRFGIPSNRISHIYHILDDDKIRENRVCKKNQELLRREIKIPNHYKKLFIYVGRLTNQKKPFEFLKLVSFAKDAHKDCFFLMIGDGELAGVCDDIISKDCLSNIKRISYHPCPAELMALADGMIITSIYEGLPIAMLEALGVGIPVLATDVGDIRLVLEKYGSGQIFQNINISQNYKKAEADFSEFVGQLDLYQAAAKKNCNNICSQFGKKNISKKYHNLFKS